MSTPTLQDTEYQAAAERLLAAIERQCDAWLQQDIVDIDTNRAGSLVELEFPDRSKIVVNKQPPLHEIWLAARNGGFHFKLDGGAGARAPPPATVSISPPACPRRRAAKVAKRCASRPPDAVRARNRDGSV